MTNIDYEPLTSKITKADIDALKASKSYIADFNWTGVVIMVAVVTILSFSAVITYVSASDYSQALIASGAIFFFLLIVGVVWRINSVTIIKRYAKLYKFAIANGASFENNSRPPQIGILFTAGGSGNKISSQVGPINGTTIGSNVYTTGSGKNRHTYYWDYAVVQLTRNIPNIILDSKKNNFLREFSDMPSVPNRDQKVSLEGDFNDYFDVYSPNTYDIDVRVILTPDVMQDLQQLAADYNVEFIDNKIILFKRGSNINGADVDKIKEILNMASVIAAEVNLQSEHYSDPRIAGSRQSNIVAEQGRRLKTNMNVIWLIIFAVIVMAFQIITAVMNQINRY